MTAEPDNTAKEQRGRPFVSGESGNPAGRPHGSRNKATLAAEALLDGEAEALTRKAVDLALAGDTTALRICLDRLLPCRRSRPVCFTMPAMGKAGDAVTTMNAITAAVAAGDLDGAAVASA